MRDAGKNNLEYAVLLSAGCGTRMKHLTKYCPKCLIPVGCGQSGFFPGMLVISGGDATVAQSSM